MADRRVPAWTWTLALVLLALLGPLVSGPAEPPALAPSVAQLLPPGTRIQEADTASGGLLRALQIVETDEGLRLRGPGGWRELQGVMLTGPVRDGRLWLGSDQRGASLLARTLQGARTSLTVGALAVLFAVVIGTAAGLVAALGPRPVAAFTRLVADGILAVPRLLLLLSLGIVFRGVPGGLALAIGLVSWMDLQRLVEAESHSILARPFVEAARSTGVGQARIAGVHLLPNLIGVIAVTAPLICTDAILLESTLSYLGIGTGGASWGQMVADGQRMLPDGWWIALFPGLLLFTTALAVHTMGRAARDRSDPRQGGAGVRVRR